MAAAIAGYEAAVDEYKAEKDLSVDDDGNLAAADNGYEAAMEAYKAEIDLSVDDTVSISFAQRLPKDENSEQAINLFNEAVQSGKYTDEELRTMAFEAPNKSGAEIITFFEEENEIRAPREDFMDVINPEE